MAEKVTKIDKDCKTADETNDSVEKGLALDIDDERSQNITSYPECVVCLQSYHHPVQLPCGHVFCFLCVKGVAARSRRCALCRADVPTDYFDKPVVVDMKTKQVTQSAVVTASKKKDTGLYKWYYEGRNGWWQYEERASVQLEDAFFNGDQSTELVIAGFVYIVDIKDMVQYRKNYPTRRRRVKRDKANADKKGIAGLKSSSNNQCAESSETSNADVEKAEMGTEREQQRPKISREEIDLVAEELDKTL